MPRPRTAEVVREEIVDLQFRRLSECYLSGTSVNQSTWESIAAQIDKLNNEAKVLEAAGK